MTPDRFEELKTNESLRKRLAKLMALQCFRNSELEDFHAGVFPTTHVGDFSDVSVVSPAGEIPWNDLSRLNDQEMQSLMIDVVNHCYAFLSDLFNDKKGRALFEMLKQGDELPHRNDPQLPSMRNQG